MNIRLIAIQLRYRAGGSGAGRKDRSYRLTVNYSGLGYILRYVRKGRAGRCLIFKILKMFCSSTPNGIQKYCQLLSVGVGSWKCLSRRSSEMKWKLRGAAYCTSLNCQIKGCQPRYCCSSTKERAVTSHKWF